MLALLLCVGVGRDNGVGSGIAVGVSGGIFLVSVSVGVGANAGVGGCGSGGRGSGGKVAGTGSTRWLFFLVCVRPRPPRHFNPFSFLRFDRYKGESGSETGTEAGQAGGKGSNEAPEAAVEGKVLVWPEGCEKRRVSAAAAATFLVRDLLSTQSEDMGPQHLEVTRGTGSDGARLVDWFGLVGSA